MLRQRVAANPTLQFLLLVGECTAEPQIVGSLYTQRIPSTECLFGARYSQLADIGVSAGPVLQLIGVQLDDSVAGCIEGGGGAASAMLLEHAMRMAAGLGLNKVAAVTRCRQFRAQHTDQPINLTNSMSEHVERGDTGVQFHTARGARVQGLASQYRPSDIDNGGIGVIVEYSINQQGSIVRHSECEAVVSNCAPLGSTISSVLDECAANATHLPSLHPQRAFTEIGLDSFDLIHVTEQLSEVLGVQIPMNTVYEFTTLASLTAHLQQQESTWSSPAVPAVLTPVSQSAQISIQGLACRISHSVASPYAMWRILCQKQLSWGSIPQRWQAACSVAQVPTINAGGWIHVGESLKTELKSLAYPVLDPHVKILANVAYESLVDAGWDNETKRCAAVLTAVEPAHLVLPLGGHQISRTASHMLSTGGLHRNFDLACASGYLAIAYGVELLRKNAALKCIVASSALNLQPACMVSLTQAGILCGTGMPRPLDANANGATIGDSFLHLAG